jgi:hypothetical protein
MQTKRKVWDIINCGPRNSFTCEGLLVHNCTLLDFSGNIGRFAADFSDIYYYGLSSLSGAEEMDEKPKAEPIPKSCPECGAISFAKKCVICGFEEIIESSIEIVQATLSEIMILGKKAADSEQSLWWQCVSYARKNSRLESQEKRAKMIYKGIAGKWPKFDFKGCPDVRISLAVRDKIKEDNKKYRESLVG